MAEDPRCETREFWCGGLEGSFEDGKEFFVGLFGESGTDVGENTLLD